MKYLTWCIILSCLAVLSAEAETTVPTADDWYKNQYAPLWKENSWDKLEEIAGFYDNSVEYSLKKLIALIEPLFIIILGVLVGFIMASMLLPMFDMIKTINR